MTKCRVDGEKLNNIISYGTMPIANGFLNAEEFSKEYFFELAVAFCPTSKMFQLIEQPDPKMNRKKENLNIVFCIQKIFLESRNK